MEPVAKNPIKFRASCDGCFHAKLKCSKERPTCPRCKNLGLLCKYSPSQRSGKKASAQKGNAAQCSKQQDRTQTQYDNQNQSWEWPSELSSTLVSNALSASAVQAGVLKPAFNPGSLEHTENLNQTVGSQQQTTPTNTWPGGSDNVLRDLDESFLTPWRDYLPNSEDTSMTSPSLYQGPFDLSSTGQSSNTRMTPPPSRDETYFSTESALMTSPDELAYLKSQDETSCSCFPSIINALHTMQSEAKNCCNPPLEMILSGSKMVTARGESLLACSCSSDSTLIMLFASLIAQHLTFYFPTPKTSTPPLPDSLCPSSRSSNAARHDSLTSYTSTYPTAKIPSPSCVTIGRYTMDPESSEHLRIKIMMMELQKLNAMLGKFRGKFSALPVGYEGHAYETVLNFLNTRTREGIERLAACEKEAEGAK